MKRFLAWLLLAATALSLLGCAAEPALPESTQAAQDAAAAQSSEEGTQSAASETQAPLSDDNLFLTVSSITFSLVGESEDIYLGLAPREEVSWESEDPSVVSVEGGVLTATGVGTTVIRATCGDRQVECTAGCLAQTQEELEALAPEFLGVPKRLPPEVNMEEPCTYFDNAAIMGDSITYFLWQEESKNNYLGDMLFITRQGISINGLVRRFKNLHFRGKEMYVEDIAAECGADRIYIMLGCLDFQVRAARAALLDNWKVLLDRITEKCPDLEIVIISSIPSSVDAAAPEEYNAAVAEANVQLRQLAAESGYGFLDLSCYIQDHYGRMPEIYKKDDYHMNAEGSRVWMQILRYYAQYELEGGSLS